jgi:pimeloyl-ACP methyl ester carboxylesterase
VEPKPGVVFVVGGIGGIDPIGPLARLALPLAGVRHEVHDFIWTHGTGRWLRDLQDTRHLLVRAEELADQVRRLKEADPERPVYLIGHSGGAGLVLAAAERLPDATLERIILLSAAVSPGYDLRPALRATRREMVSYHSDLDCFVLGWGTRQFGTVDRYYCSAAGLVGFAVPADLDNSDRDLYARLKQIAWKPEMILKSHGGLHSSPCMPGFLARQVAPWLQP